MASARPAVTPALNLIPASASFGSAANTNSYKIDPNRLILHLLRAITILSTLASIFLLCYIIRSEDAQRLFLQLLNAANEQEERKDAAVEQSAGARSIIVAIYTCLVTSCTSNYFLLQEKNSIRTRAAVIGTVEQSGLSDEGFVLASLSCSSHAFVSFLLFGTFRINLYNGIQLAAFFFGLIGLVQTLLFLVLAAFIVKREKMASKLASGSNETEMNDWKMPPEHQEEKQDKEIISECSDPGTTSADFIRMPDVDEQDSAKSEVELV